MADFFRLDLIQLRVFAKGSMSVFLVVRVKVVAGFDPIS